MIDLHLAAQAAPITIELPTAVSAAAWVGAVMLAGIGALVGLCVWFLRRDIKNNDEAHRELRTDVKTLLSAVGRIEGTLTGSGRSASGGSQ